MTMMKPEGSSTMAASIIDEDVTIAGHIISNGKVQIEGKVQGYIFCSNLRICDGGWVAGGIVAEKVTVHGRISGSINALSVTLGSTSHTEADINYQMLKIEHGGYFEGQSRPSENPLSQAMAHLDTFRKATVATSSGELLAIKIERAA
jgi:cytoskeletal protein CcmA (bactofilin family)